MPKQRFGCIYRLTNTVTGKSYIGQTIDYKQRMSSSINYKNSYKNKRRSYIMNSISKHGWDNFTKEILLKTSRQKT